MSPAAPRRAAPATGAGERFRPPPEARIAAGTPDHLRLAILLTCRRPELRPLCAGMLVSTDPALGAPFQVEAGRRIALHPASLAEPAMAAVTLRHALELALWQRLGCRAAAPSVSRVAALYARSLPSAESLHALARIPAEVRASHQTALDEARLLELAAPSEHLLIQGGGSRLNLDPACALNPYGCPARPRPDALSFASSTASTISAPAYGAVEATRQSLLQADLEGGLPEALATLTRAIKQELLAACGIDPRAGVEAILLPSGTDGELAALQIARRRQEERLVNIVIAPAETGSGVPEAARGRHFAAQTPHGRRVRPGEPLAGLDPATITVETVEIRAADGTARPLAVIDAEVVALAEQALAAGARCLIHLLDASKTGLTAPSRGALERLHTRHHTRLEVLVDACQMRQSQAALRADLARGWMVLLTGSKFAMGPPFSGALLLPARLADPAGRDPLPAGFGDYFCQPEWPDAWRPLTRALPEQPNFGLLLRWRAALWELQTLEAVPGPLRERIAAELGAAITATLARTPQLDPVEGPGGATQTIFPFRLLPARGPLGPEPARQVWRWLREDLSDVLAGSLPPAERRLAGFVCEVGQPVRIGAAGALRLCLGAHLISQVAFNPALGRSFEQRLRRQVANARIVLDKAALIARHLDQLAVSAAPQD
jgi:hypothetical protein